MTLVPFKCDICEFNGLPMDFEKCFICNQLVCHLCWGAGDHMTSENGLNEGMCSHRKIKPNRSGHKKIIIRKHMKNK